MTIVNRNELTDRVKASAEILQHISALSKRATELAVRMEDRFSPVTTEPEVTKGSVNEPPKKTYPQLFKEIEDHLNEIELALNSYEDIMSRAEI